jgi:hypothetical protein
MWRKAWVILPIAAGLSANEEKHQRARELVLEACTACHTLDRVRVQRLTREEWRGEIGGMLSEGVPLKEEEMTLVVDYLAEHFGPKSR